MEKMNDDRNYRKETVGTELPSSCGYKGEKTMREAQLTINSMLLILKYTMGSKMEKLQISTCRHTHGLVPTYYFVP